jgi:hypothetical protein
MVFEGFQDADFNAFEEKKWSSHAYNRERLEVKLKLAELGKMLDVELGQIIPGLEVGVTEERPSIFNQHCTSSLTLYFIRDEKARRDLSGILDRAKSIAENVSDPAVHHRHIMLGVRIGHQGVEGGLWLHQNAWVDWKNIVQRCREYWERDQLNDLLSALPDNVFYSRGKSIDSNAEKANQLKADVLLSSFEQVGPWSVFGQSIDRNESILASESFVGWVVDFFRVLESLHTYISWKRDNDFHNITEVLKEHKERAQMSFRKLSPGDEVRILEGLASGRIGVVESIERKGIVKVRLGAMVISLKMEELGSP